MRRVYPHAVRLGAEDQAKTDAFGVQYKVLCDEHQRN